MIHYADDWLTVYLGDCRQVMSEMEPESVHTVVTSPPYWGLRDYGEPGQLGLEATPEQYVESMVAVFRQVRRVLRSDGTVWLNLGDSYAGGGQERPGSSDAGSFRPHDQIRRPGIPKPRVVTLKPKDLVGIPWRVAFALQADGWYLRSDIIWSKPNPMPESVTDRPTKSHEYLFLLSKSPRYYFDADAAREANTSPEQAEHNARYAKVYDAHTDRVSVRGEGIQPGNVNNVGIHSRGGATVGRNIRSVWTIATQPYPGAHFATFPRALVEPCVKAGTSEKGVCPECGAPWERVVERTTTGIDERRPTRSEPDGRMPSRMRAGDPSTTTTGWRPSCSSTCDYGEVDHQSPVPATVLDPFAGSGTTGMVAQRLSRRAVLIDLNADYLDQAMERNRDMPLGLGA